MSKVNKCSRSRICAFYKAFGYCSKQIGEDCLIVFEEKKNDIKFGDFIRFHNTEDMVRTMYELQAQGIETDFCYEHDGQYGKWLEVLSVS